MVIRITKLVRPNYDLEVEGFLQLIPMQSLFVLFFKIPELYPNLYKKQNPKSALMEPGYFV